MISSFTSLLILQNLQCNTRIGGVERADPGMAVLHIPSFYTTFNYNAMLDTAHCTGFMAPAFGAIIP